MPDPSSAKALPIPSTWSHLVALNPAYNVLICRSPSCRYALSPTALARHLYNRHQTSIDIRRQVQQYVKHFPFTYNEVTVPLPDNGSAPQPIIPVVDGLACRACTFKSISRDAMRQHANKAHDQRKIADADIFTAVRLQSWFGKKRERYWRVEDNDGQQVVREHQAIWADAGEESNGPEPQEQLGLRKPQSNNLQYAPDTTLYIQSTN
jgi:hypothetical protein